MQRRRVPSPGGPVVETSSSNTGGASSAPDQGAPHASGPKNQNIKQKQHCNKFNKDFFLRQRRSFTNHLEMEIKKEEKKEIKANHLEYLTRGLY